jgi:RNA polymerase sigma-70 factor, ECF subfamily
MIVPAAPPPSRASYDTGGRPPQATVICRQFRAIGRFPGGSSGRNIAGIKVFVRMIWFSDKEQRVAKESALSGFRQGIEAAVPALRRYARALTRNAELADDLVQDTLVRALRSEHLFHGGELRSWLYTILTNLNRNRLRSLARRPAVQAIDDNDAPDMAGPEAGARDIERALASLVEDQRAALLLVVLEGLSYREVAEVQGVPIGTVMSRLARARVQIKAYLDGERPTLRRVK